MRKEIGWLRGRLSGQRGQALAEFLIVVPLLLLILMGAIGFGHAIFTKMIVVQAANRAARLGATLYGDSSVSSSSARKQTRDAGFGVLSASLSGTNRDVLVSVSGDDVTVTVRYESTTFVPLLKPWLGSRMMMEHKATYRIERDTAE